MTTGIRAAVALAIYVLADQAQAGLITGFPADSENGCLSSFQSTAPGYSCSYNESSFLGLPEFAPTITVPWASVAGWQGPIYLGGFYAPGSAPGVANPGGVVVGGKAPPALHGDITVTGSGASAQVSMAVSYAASDYSFNDGLGNYGDIHWGSLIFTLTGRTVDSATGGNPFGGFDYVIGSDGFPDVLRTQSGNNPFPTEVGASGLNYWNAPNATTVPTSNYPDTAGIASYEYRDPNWDTEVPGQTGQFVQNIGATAQGSFGTVVSCVDTFGPGSACASTWNFMNKPDIKLIMRISTDGTGAVVTGEAYAVREGNMIGGPGGLLGDSDAYAATVWNFDQTTATDSDADGIVDTADNCPTDANGPVIPDAYGTSQGDHDGDGTANACDTDDDNDGTLDVADGCPIDPLGIVDVDNDGACDYNDNCPNTPNGPLILDADDDGIAQRNTDGDAEGDACDTDDDNDGLADTLELGLMQGSTERLNPDTDGDGTLDGADAFPLNPFESVDTDSDGIGDNTDGDDDNDGVLDVNDAFPLDPTEWDDTDGDGMGDNSDNCRLVQNTAAFPDSEGWDPQQDDDSDTIGNACDLVIPPQFIPAAKVGNTYGHSVIRLRGTPPFTWTMTSGFLPQALAFYSPGFIFGNVIAGGITATFTAQVMDSNGDTATRVLKLRSRLPNCYSCHTGSIK